MGGHPQHHLSNEAGQSTVPHSLNDSLLMGSGIVPHKQFNSVATNKNRQQQPQRTTTQPSHQSSEFTFHPSSRQSQHKQQQQTSGQKVAGQQVQYAPQQNFALVLNASTVGPDSPNWQHETGQTQESPRSAASEN